MIYDQFCLDLPDPVNAELEAKVYEGVKKGSFPEDETTECSTEVASHWDVLLVAMEKALWAALQVATRLGFWLLTHAHACCAGSLAS